MLVAALLFFCSACKHQQKPEDQTNNEQKTAERPSFSADSAYAFTEAQCAFGPRVPNTEAHRKCSAYLTAAFRRFCDTVYVQEFNGKAYNGILLKSKNIIGCFNPEAKERILVASHWDSRPYADHDPDPAMHRTPIDGANDGAAGVGILLEIARQLSLKHPDKGIDLVCFDSEDYGAPQDDDAQYSEDDWCLGSQYWAQHPHRTAYSARFGILLDMVGGPNALFCKEGTSAFYAQDILNRVWNYAAGLGYSSDFSSRETAPIIDDHLYINKLSNIPMIDIIEYNEAGGTGFNPTWHTLKDNMENISRATLQKVGEVVLYTLYNE